MTIANPDGVNPSSHPIFGKRLRVALAAAELTPSRLAYKLGVTQQAVHFWMNGSRCPSSKHLVEICHLTGVFLDWIMQPHELEFLTSALIASHPSKGGEG